METLETKSVSYWGNTGTYQSEFDSLTKELMPRSGEAETLEGELIRIANRFYYDYCNNGNMNILEIEYETEEYNTGELDEDGDEIWEEEETELEGYITEYYDMMLRLVKREIPNSEHIVISLETLICEMEHNCNFNQSEYDIYNAFIDMIVEHVLSKEGSYANFEGYDSLR